MKKNHNKDFEEHTDDNTPQDSRATTSWRYSSAVQVTAICTLIILGVIGYARWQTGSNNLVLPWLQGQRLLFADTRIHVGNVGKQERIERPLQVKNLSSKPLTLLGSQKSCGCISLDEFPVVIPPGEEYELTLGIGTTDKPGQFGHAIKFFTDEPGHSAVNITVTGIVM